MRRRTLILFLLSSTLLAGCQGEPPPAEPPGIEVALTPGVPDREGDRWVRWSPYGKQLPLTPDGEGMVASLPLGSPGTTYGLRLSRSGSSPYFDQLTIDHNRDGVFQDAERLTTTPSETRNKFWSSFDTSLDLPVTDPWSGEVVHNPYPMSLWYVEDPRLEEQDTVIRFSRDGWMEGSITLDRIDALLLVTESAMDGVFDTLDSWALASADSAVDLFKPAYARDLTEHNWLFETAYVVTEIDPSGRRVVLAPHDPGMTRAEEEAMNDDLAVDRQAPRSGRTVAFLHDFEEAQARARAEGKRLLVDFETTWCGPCKLMDQWVYTADAVVEAAAAIVSVKVDGDERLDLKERFGVEGFPTQILLDVAGEELGRKTGYVSVEAMTAFLTGSGVP